MVQTSYMAFMPFLVLTVIMLAALAAQRPREHAVDAEVFAELTHCGLAMIKRGQAVNEVS